MSKNQNGRFRKKVCVYCILTMAKKTYNKYRVRTRTTKGGDEMTPNTTNQVNPPTPPVQENIPSPSTPVQEQTAISNSVECPKKPWWKFWAGKRSSKRTMKKRCYKNKTSKKAGKSMRNRK